jgi:hypothetical protein
MSEKHPTNRQLLPILTVLIIGAVAATISVIFPQRMLASGTVGTEELPAAVKTRVDLKTDPRRKQKSEQANIQLTKSLKIAATGISIRFPENWSTAQPTQNSWVIINVPVEQQDTTTPSVRMMIGYLERSSHADAVSQLAEYANESRKPSTFLAIGGWPGLQRVQLIKRPQPGEGPRFPDPDMIQITTAVAAGNLLVRIEAGLPSNADQQLKDVVLGIGQSLTFETAGDPAQVQQDLDRLEGLSKRPISLEKTVPLPEEPKPVNIGEELAPNAPIFSQVQLNNLGTNGELEVAVSNNGTNIVVVKQGAFVSSNDGGNNFSFSGGFGFGDGDSSVGFAQSGAFYVSGLFGGNCPANSNCIEVTRSTDNGRTFPTANLSNGVVCPNTGATACNVDQEHLAADRVNAAAGGADRVYLVVRIGDSMGRFGPGFSVANITCSPDNGAHWSPLFALENNSDFPRITVGGDGSVYTVFASNGAGSGNIRIDKFNPCPALNTMTMTVPAMTRTAATFPNTVSAFTTFAGCQVMNGFGGLDRCNNGNILTSPTVTVDDTNANHVYVAWANNTAANNENVLVTDSTNGGVNWRATGPVTANTNVTARRFMPWVCATGGNAFVSWYDRRAATVANNDLTDFFAASAGLSAGNLVANNDEFKITTTSDAQCTLWPTGPRSTFDSENCSVQPQLAGNCSINTATRCDFSDCAGGGGVGACQCPAGQTCQTDGFGVNPKYGDYNGNACALGRMYTVFASGAGLTSVRDFFQSFVVASTPTTVTYTGATSADFHDPANLSATLTLSGTTSPVAGQTITFTIGTQSCTGVTNATGVAQCTLVLNQVPGPYTVTASFAGAGLFQASSASAPFTITREETTLTYTGDTVIANNTTAHLSAVLLEDGVVPIAGRTVVFTLGTGATAQTCNGITDAAGVAACTIFPVNQPFGAGTVTADFAGDAFYLPSSDSATTIIFAFLDHGAFVVGDLTATGLVEFWGEDWSHQNVLSGRRVSPSFKGFADSISTNPPACGDTWTSGPGNSAKPPDTLPPFMGVVVSNSITKSGSTISGNVHAIVVVQTDPGYAPNPGHPGKGTVVAVYCH